MAGEDRYRLTPVRDARAREEQGRRGDLAVAIGDADATGARLDAARKHTHAARSTLAAAIAARTMQTTAAHIAAGDRYIARRRHELDEALAEELHAYAAHEQRLGTVDVARERLARARAERQVIERHFERWRQERKKLADRRDD